MRTSAGAGPAAVADRTMSLLHPVCAALVAGVAAFAAAVAWLFLGGEAPLSPGVLPESVFFAAAAALAGVFIAAPVLERRMREAPPDASMSDVASRFQSAAIVGFVLREGSGMVGLVLSLLSGTVGWALGFAAASMAAMALAWPRREALEARLRKAAARG